MVCQKCGTQSFERFCPECGEPLQQDHLTPVVPKQSPQTAKKAKKAAKTKQPMRKLWPTFLLFLPLIYLLFDIFVCFPEQMMQPDVLSSLFSRLFDEEFLINGTSELFAHALGTGTPVFAAVSFLSRTAAPFLIYVVVTLCAVCVMLGILILLSRGSLLRFGVVRDLLAFFGTAAACAPLTALFAQRLLILATKGGDAAQASAVQFGLSLQGALALGVVLCLMPPALSHLRKIGAGCAKEYDHVPYPLACLQGRSMRFLRMFAILMALASLLVGFGGLYLAPFAVNFSVDDAILNVTALKEMFAELGGFFAGGTTPDAMEISQLLTRVFGSLVAALFLIAALALVVETLSLLFFKKKALLRRRGAPNLAEVGKSARNTILAPVVCATLLQLLLLVVCALLGMRLGRVSFTDVQQTLSVFYITLGYARSLFLPSNTYCLFLLFGAVCWHVTKNSATLMLCRAYRQIKNKEENQ